MTRLHTMKDLFLTNEDSRIIILKAVAANLTKVFQAVAGNPKSVVLI